MGKVRKFLHVASNFYLYTFQLVGEAVWSESRDKSLAYRNFLYALCVAHGFNATRESYSPRAISTQSRLNAYDLINAIDFARKHFGDSSDRSLSVRDICTVICEVSFFVSASILRFLSLRRSLVSFIKCIIASLNLHPKTLLKP